MLKSFWFWVLMIFIVMQFFSMDIPAKLPIDKKEEIQAPKLVMSILKRSCYDCHSSEVKTPWYYDIAPSSWYTQLHVKNAREHINFSKWNTYSVEKKEKMLKKIPKAIVIRMPLNSYLYLHEEAKLSKEDKLVLKKWARELKEKIK